MPFCAAQCGARDILVRKCPLVSNDMSPSDGMSSTLLIVIIACAIVCALALVVVGVCVVVRLRRSKEPQQRRRDRRRTHERKLENDTVMGAAVERPRTPPSEQRDAAPLDGASVVANYTTGDYVVDSEFGADNDYVDASFVAQRSLASNNAPVDGGQRRF